MSLSNNKVPSEGFFVSERGVLYLDGQAVVKKKFDAKGRSDFVSYKERVRFSNPRKRKGVVEDEEFCDMVEGFMPAAKGLANVWDKAFQGGRHLTKKVEHTPMYNCPSPSPSYVWSSTGTENTKGTITAGTWQVGPVTLKNTPIEDIVNEVEEQQNKQIALLGMQVDSLQQQIDVVKAIKIDEDYEDEKFDSFKNQAKGVLKDAYAVIEDMEGLDKLHQAKAIKQEALKENKRQLIITQQRVKERLERIQAVNRAEEKKETKWSYYKIIFAIIALALVAAFIPVLLGIF